MICLTQYRSAITVKIILTVRMHVINLIRWVTLIILLHGKAEIFITASYSFERKPSIVSYIFVQYESLGLTIHFREIRQVTFLYRKLVAKYMLCVFPSRSITWFRFIFHWTANNFLNSWRKRVWVLWSWPAFAPYFAIQNLPVAFLKQIRNGYSW